MPEIGRQILGFGNRQADGAGRVPRREAEGAARQGLALDGHRHAEIGRQRRVGDQCDLAAGVGRPLEPHRFQRRFRACRDVAPHRQRGAPIRPPARRDNRAGNSSVHRVRRDRRTRCGPRSPLPAVRFRIRRRPRGCAHNWPASRLRRRSRTAPLRRRCRAAGGRAPPRPQGSCRAPRCRAPSGGTRSPTGRPGASRRAASSLPTGADHSPCATGRLPRRSAMKLVRQGYSCGMKFLCLARKKKGSISPFIGWSGRS